MYTELYCDPVNGNNMNGGAPIGGSYPFVHTNGGWNSATGVFTPASGNPQSEGVTVGDFAAVFTDGGTTPNFVGRVTARDATTITIDTGAFCTGTVPTTAASGLTCRVGGAWKGPNGSDTWPCNNTVSLNKLISAASVWPRLNLKNNGSYLPTVPLTTAGFVNATVQGYTATVGDGGRATIDGGGNAMTLWTNSSTNAVFKDLIFVNSASSSTNDGFSNSAPSCHFENVVVHGMQGRGFSNTGAGVTYEGCEAYANNRSNTANFGGFVSSVAVAYSRCISHDNAGSNSHGFVNSGGSSGILSVLHNCIAESNDGSGLLATSGAFSAVFFASGCDFYNNGASGCDLSANGAAQLFAQNCNFVKNGVYGVNTHATAPKPIILQNCGFGTGTQANVSGDLPASAASLGVQNLSPVTYASGATPWVDPANGDFRISLAAAKGTGIGAFTQTAASYAGTIAYPDIGAAQHRESAGAAAARTRITTPGVLVA